MDSPSSNHQNNFLFSNFSDPFAFLRSSPPAQETSHPTDPLSNSQLPFDQAITSLEAKIGFNLKPGQLEALEKLYNHEDVLLVAKTGFGKTTIFTGFHEMFDKKARAITLIISPLKAIQNSQAEDTAQLGREYQGFVLNGETNTVKNRHDIARGGYTHIWTSAEIALGDIVVKKVPQKESRKTKETSGVSKFISQPRMVERIVRHRKHEFPDGYVDHGTFQSVLQDSEFKRRLALIAVDEIHLCSEKSWGGSFRSAMGQLFRLRQQVGEHTRMFGTTATLRQPIWEEVCQSTGFNATTSVIRTSIYRSDVFLYMLPTDEPKAMFKRVVLSAYKQAQESERLLPKTIFFMKEVSSCTSARDEIISWLDELYQKRVDRSIVKTYHAHLTDKSRVDIESEFSDGRVRFLCATIAYALGVNPAGVQYVVQKGRCDTDEALQKLGRANRQANLDHAVFFWLPEAKVTGDRQKPRTLKYAPRQWTRLEDLVKEAHRHAQEQLSGSESDASTVASQELPAPGPSSTGKRKRGGSSQKNPSRWREEQLVDGEYEVYNPPPGSCYWGSLLARYHEEISFPCGNCSSCCSLPFNLVELPIERRVFTERGDIVKCLQQSLSTLAEELGNSLESRLIAACEPDPAERVLTTQWRKKLSMSYYRVASGDLLGWPWERQYGTLVVNHIRQFTGLTHMPCSSRVSMETPHPPLLFNSSFSSQLSSVSDRVLQDVTNEQRLTPRGIPALMKEKGKSSVARPYRRSSGKENRTQ